MTSSAPDAASTVRRVTMFTAACVLVSNMIGTGIFGSTGFMAGDLGSPLMILLLWVLGAVYALLGTLAYGELGAAMPRAGGEYVYIREAYGPLLGFLSGWMSLAIGFSAAIAANAHLFAYHLAELFPAFQAPAEGGTLWQVMLRDGKLLQLGVVWLLTAVHIIGVGVGGFVQQVLTIVKVGAMLLLIAAGVTVGQGSWSNFEVTNPAVFPPASGLDFAGTALVSFMFVTFSYSGWNAASYLAGEIKNPERSLPRAMILGTLCVAAIYLAMNVVYIYALPVTGLIEGNRAVVGHNTAIAMFGPGIGRWFTGLLAVSIVGATSAMIWAGPRVYYAMAQDGVFPRFFAATSKNDVPHRSMVLQSAWISVLVFVSNFPDLVIYTAFMLIVFSGLAVAAVFVLRRTAPDMPRPFRAWGHPWTTLVYLVFSVAILAAAIQRAIQYKSTEAMWSILTVAAGIPFYFLWRKR